MNEKVNYLTVNMKNVLIFSLLIYLGCSDIITPEQVVEVERIALLEVFGYSLCPNCYYADHAADSLYKEYNDKLFVLEYHHLNDGLPVQFQDTLSPQPETNNRTDWYNISAFPTSFINGEIKKEGAGLDVINEYRNYIELQLTKEAGVELELENWTFVSSGILNIYLNYTVPDFINFNNTRLFCILTEDSVFFKQTGARDSLYNHVVRLFVPDEDGISISENDTLIEITYPLKQYWEIENIEFVVFLQNLNTREVYQVSGIKP